MRRIYFYSPSATGGKVVDNDLYVNTTPVYLHSYIKRHDPEILQHITWAKIQLIEKTQAEIVEEIKRYQCDLICASIYIWNSHVILQALQGIKQQIPWPVTVIVGGPSVDPHRDRDYLLHYPDIDYAVYAQGEQAFLDILRHLETGRRLDPVSSKNLSWKDQGRTKVSQFQFIKQAAGSPYVEAQEILRQIVQDPEYQGRRFFMPYETSKGCAYNCTFCDWTSGLTHKVSHRKFAWEEELELLGELGLTNFHLSDSNFGQHRQDIDIARTMAALKQTQGYPFYITDTNFSKLRKKESFAILKVLLDAGIVTNPKFAVQDIHDLILENIERPDVPWPEHRAYIQEIKDLYPEFECRIEIIMGLPGQTRDTWEETLIAIDLGRPTIYSWTILPNSPAGYDPGYREKMAIKTMHLPLEWGNPVSTELVIGTYSYDFRDYIYFMLLSVLVTNQFGAQIKDRRQFFDLVRRSQYLEQVLDVVQSSFVTNDRKVMRKSVDLFLEKLIQEFKYQWHPQVIKDWVLFRKNLDRRDDAYTDQSGHLQIEGYLG